MRSQIQFLSEVKYNVCGDLCIDNFPPPPFCSAGGEGQSFGGKVISVKCGDYTRRIGIDGTPDAIKEAIKSAFGIRTKRAFWLEDEDQIVRCIDRDMPVGNYTLHLDEGKLLHMWFL